VRFSEAKEKRGFEYDSGVEKARRETVESCKEISKRLTDKEVLHLGGMLSAAAKVVPGDDSLLDKWREADRSYRELMSD
jgi:hypothetical protein